VFAQFQGLALASTAAAGIPVFVLSASDPTGLEVLKYFQKPINVDRLLNAIQKYFSAAANDLS
jgi:hypothetical protein